MLDRLAPKRESSVLLRASARGLPLYDHYGHYALSFAAGFATNLFNFAVIGTSVLRRRLTVAGAV
jgi:hypothetical protein